jgi:hypothetical protein
LSTQPRRLGARFSEFENAGAQLAVIQNGVGVRELIKAGCLVAHVGARALRWFAPA